MFLGLQDLVDRWTYSRQGVHKLAASRDFPAPAFAVNRGRVEIWRHADIEAYERTHPELTSEEAKHLKVIGFARARAKGRKG